MLEFTKRAKRVINEIAQDEAKRLGSDFIGPEHILLGLLREEDSVAIKILTNLNINLNELRKEVEKRTREGSGALLLDVSQGQDKYQKMIEVSKEEAKRLKHNYVGTEHILLALLRDNNNIAGGSLSSFSVNYNVIKSEILRLLGAPPSGAVGGNTGTQSAGQSQTQTATPRQEKSKTPILDEFARDLTQLAREKKLDPVIGRSKEIERVIQILSRKTKNNPVLVGESGVGKTAIVEGLAQAVVEKLVPDLLFDKRVLSLDLASLIAGTKYRGEFEERLKKIMKEIVTSQNIIIFIDELHTLIGAGAAEGAVDAANILKPALARGELQCIGATTNNEYRKYIEKDSALERRFQMVKVLEPSVDDAVLILDGLKKAYEAHHKVRYSEKAIEQAVKLSHRYINDRFLPDKAIDIIDEAGA
ncbi:MAG: Clp protease N-terminal domain-containing protein, partial [Leptospira bouyouniensis]